MTAASLALVGCSGSTSGGADQSTAPETQASSAQVPADYPGLPLHGVHLCGSVESGFSGKKGSPVRIASGDLSCEDAMSIAVQYEQKAKHAHAPTKVGGWRCAPNVKHGQPTAGANIACHRGDDSITYG